MHGQACKHHDVHAILLCNITAHIVLLVRFFDVHAIAHVFFLHVNFHEYLGNDKFN